MNRYYEVLRWFTERMNKKLIENQHKDKEGVPGWHICTRSFLLSKLEEENREVQNAGNPKTLKKAQQLIDECADVANVAMMIADNAHFLIEDAAMPGGK